MRFELSFRGRVRARAPRGLGQGRRTAGRSRGPSSWGDGVPRSSTSTKGAAGKSRSAVTAADGGFSFDAVPPGSFVVSVSAAGFAPTTRTVRVQGARAPLTIAVALEGVREDVTVRGRALVGTVATGKTTVPVRDLPMTIESVSSPANRRTGRERSRNRVQERAGRLSVHRRRRTLPGLGFFAASSTRCSSWTASATKGNRVNTQLTNIERIEVLKGPSSALYGGSALGATVNLIRKKPSATPTYDFMGARGKLENGARSVRRHGRLGTATRSIASTSAAKPRKATATTTDTFTMTPSLAWSGRSEPGQRLLHVNRDQFGATPGCR